MSSSLVSRLGFTLIELLVVIAIIGILAAVVLASLDSSRDQARGARAEQEMSNIRTAMELLHLDTKLYPHKQPTYCPPRNAADNEVNLALAASGLVTSDGTYPNWSGPYTRGVIDPWGTPYFLDEDYYCTAGARGCGGFSATNVSEIWSVLVSCGPDGRLGDDPSNPQPSNGTACAYNDDNIVLPLCRN